MALKTLAWVCPSESAPLQLQEIEIPPLQPNQVQIDMLMSGLCHTDIHMQKNDWGISKYPMVPGHEGIGIVSQVGAEVRNLKIGDKVGVGWIRDSCGECESCSRGRENVCLKGYQGTYLACDNCWGKEDCCILGCFAKDMRVNERFAFKIPDNIPDELAAPLMCAGGTLYEPVMNYVKPGMKVGIIGIGGLGTLGIKLSKLQKAEVTAFSRSSSKRAGATAAGASGYVDMSDEASVSGAAGSMDVIIDTTPVSAENTIATMMDFLKFGGTYCRVGIPPASSCSYSYNWILQIFCQKTIAGSIVAGSERTNSLLDLASKNAGFMQADDPQYTIRTIPFDKVNDAMSLLEGGQNVGCWRTVLKWG